MWTDEQLAHLKVRDGFRMRGGEITRLEALTDGAIALAMTFLVIATSQVPGSFTALIDAFKQAPSFAASFCILLLFWSEHVRWSRRYGLEDGAAIALTGFLIFTILIFVYPLKIIFGVFFAHLSDGWLPSPMRFDSFQQLKQVFVAYGIGFILLEVSLYGLYRLALRQREEISLNPLEIFDTEVEARRRLNSLLVAVISLLLALLLPLNLVPISAYVYLVIPFEKRFFRSRSNRLRQQLFANASRQPR